MSAPPLLDRRHPTRRRLSGIQRRLVRIPIALEDSLSGRVPTLPALPRAAQGYAVTALAEARRDALADAGKGMISVVPRRYNRYHTDLSIGIDAWRLRIAKTRVSLADKARRIADVSGGDIRVHRYADPDEMLAFHDRARRVALRTYRDALPDDDAFFAGMLARAAAGETRGWVLDIAGEPAAFLYAPARGDTLRYEHAAQDPAFDDWSPAAILTLEAIHDLYEERKFARFDFADRDGPDKRGLATGGTPCLDMLLLRPSLANRLAATTIDGMNAAREASMRLAQSRAVRELTARARLVRN